ncbi:SprT-like domain-containing protein (plasmid) [Clostridium beijerinckii]|uniref:SprT-like domain-containing protein n=1 Tax=Clostridium beijerinckii TaxID=1520 RepID=UPI00222743DC|nr:SprT-like domain-containing protein [Clostridium beijerinckii]UYZ39051.1 SprT-like domain-containing protein [Clostridium beijerinckii]
MHSNQQLELYLKNCSFSLNDIRNRVDLEEDYTYFNHLYFDDALTPVDFITIHWNTLLGANAGMCIKNYKSTILELNPIYLNLYPEEYESILVHEMIHLITLEHDKKFLQEAKRISNLGLEITINCKHNLNLIMEK